MTIEEIKDAVMSGKFTLQKGKTLHKRIKRYYYPIDTKGEWLEYPALKKGKVEMIKKWYGDLERYEFVEYIKYRYMAMETPHRGFKLTKKDFNNLQWELDNK